MTGQVMHSFLVQNALIVCDRKTYSGNILFPNFAANGKEADIRGRFFSDFFSRRFPTDYTLPSPSNIGFDQNVVWDGRVRGVRYADLNSGGVSGSTVDISFFTQNQQDKGVLALIGGMHLRFSALHIKVIRDPAGETTIRKETEDDFTIGVGY